MIVAGTETRHRLRAIARAVLPYWLILLTIGSFLPSPAKRVLGTQPGFDMPVQADSRWQHRAWHLAAFGSTGLLAVAAVAAKSARFVAGAHVFTLGVLIELTQAVVWSAPVEWWDIRDDFYGVGAVVVGTQALTMLRRSSRA